MDSYSKTGKADQWVLHKAIKNSFQYPLESTYDQQSPIWEPTQTQTEKDAFCWPLLQEQQRTSVQYCSVDPYKHGKRKPGTPALTYTDILKIDTGLESADFKSLVSNGGQKGLGNHRDSRTSLDLSKQAS